MHPRKFFLTPKNQVKENEMHPRKFFLSPKNQVEDLTGSSCTSHQQSCLPDPIYVSSSSSDDENDLPNDDDVSKQLVLYDPASNENNKIELAPGPLPLQCEPPPLLDLLPRSKPSRSVPKVLPSVGAFTAQCASCFKWRLIPTKEKYEEIREHILEQPFVCQRALEWRPDVSCDDPEDISQMETGFGLLISQALHSLQMDGSDCYGSEVKEVPNLQMYTM
uniref:CW-type domain-containing protein n=1 Tax=Lotus japonicus TaxID=34305 RepID=I3T9G7_LOTJA|nr:unknown [Lotus japonicus]